jgi:hypothetical protein
MAIRKLIGIAFLMTAAIGWAQTSPQDQAAHHPQGDPAAAARAPAMGDPHADMARIRELMEKAEHARTTAERERLLTEHLAAMHRLLAGIEPRQCSMDEQAGMAHGAESADRAGHGMMAGGMKADHMKRCHTMMNARMEILAELLAQTWRREELRRK